MFFKVFMIIFIILAVGLPTAYLTNKHVKKNENNLLGKSNGLNGKVKSCEEKFGKNYDYEKSDGSFALFRDYDDELHKYNTLDISKEYNQEIYDRGFERICAFVKDDVNENNNEIKFQSKNCNEWRNDEIPENDTFDDTVQKRLYIEKSLRRGVVDACALFGQ